MQHRSMLVTVLRRGSRIGARALACAVMALAAAPLVAADWKPTAQIEIVIPNSPGGGNDAVGRLLQKLLQDRRLIPTAAIVSNKPAGGGSATLSYLGQKANDPHIIAVVSITQQLNYITGTQAQRYRDFTPLATMIGDFIGFAVRADSPITSGKDLLERLKKDPSSVAAGITALVCGQAAINLAAALGIAPLTGIPLPFVSYGGSSLVVLLAAMGILLNIAVNGRVVGASVRDRSGRDRRTRTTRSRSRRSSSRARGDGDVRRVARPRRVAARS